MINIKGLSKTYGSHQALTDVSIDVPEGSIYGLLGPNGAGKTTLIRIINRIINSDSGEINIDGSPLSVEHIPLIGYLPEERGLYKKMTVGDHLIYLGQLRGLSRKESIHRIKDWTARLQIDQWHRSKIEDLSKGMAQKIQFIGTVIHHPRLLILDEPFSGFDPVNANLIKDEILRLQKEGTTILFSTHRMESVEELCDHLTLINKSKAILSGEIQEIKNQFKEGVYQVSHSGNLMPAPTLYEVQSEFTQEEVNQSTIKLMNGVSTNQFLQSIIENGNSIFSFQESIPSINDIFIALTTKGHE